LLTLEPVDATLYTARIRDSYPFWQRGGLSLYIRSPFTTKFRANVTECFTVDEPNISRS
jgi:hypothetical protein